jgi:hypothetical protein
MAIATAGVLTRADLPGFTTKAHGDHDGSDDTAIDACTPAWAVNEKYTAQHHSPTFTLGRTEIDSSVDVVENAEQGRADLSALTKAQSCLKRALETDFSGTFEGATLSDQHISSSSARLATGVHAVVFDFGVTVSSNGIAIRVNTYVILALAGTAEISIAEVAVGSPPVPFARLKTLAATAALRARAAA